MLDIIKFPTALDTQEGNLDDELTLGFFRLSLDGFLLWWFELSGLVVRNEVEGRDWPEFLLICRKDVPFVARKAKSFFRFRDPSSSCRPRSNRTR